MKIQLLIIGTFILISCGTSKTFTYGEFEQVENSDNKLILKKDSFEFINTHKPFDLAVYPCCGDRMAFGTWTKDKDSDFLRLTSQYGQFSILDVNIEESSDESDSITFIIINPIEKHHDKFNEIVRDINYTIILETSNFKLNDLQFKKFNQDIIRIKRPIGTLVKSIRIFIEPINTGGRPINVYGIDTHKYEVKNENSNKFIIDIPDLSYEFISSIRLENDFVKIVNVNKLEWNGQFYKRKE
jgi:hypothetical protein